MPMKHPDRILAIGLAALVLAGMVLAYLPVYSVDLSVEVEDGEVTFTYDANYGVETHTTLIHTEGGYDLQHIAVYFDEGYAAYNSWSDQAEFFDDMGKQLSIRGIDSFEYYDAESLAELLLTADPSTTAVFIAAGSISDLIYDGTADCPLVAWLQAGGTVINIGGVLGKYVSHGPDGTDIETVTGFAALIIGDGTVPDLVFMDSPTSIYTMYQHNTEAEEYLGIYLNEITYGINVNALGSYLSIGTVSEEGFSAAVLFGSYSGMVVNFGMVLSIHPHTGHFVAQAIAAGLDYTAVFVDHADGNTYGDASGTFTIDGDGYHIYGYAGSTRAVFGKRIVLEWS